MFSFVEIFTRPGKVFARVRQQKIWLTPFLAAVLLLTLPTVIVISTAGIELLTLQRYQHNQKLTEKIGGESAVDRTVNSSNDRWTKMIIVGRVAASTAVALIAIAAACMLATGFLDQRPNFFATLGVLSYSIVPFAFAGVLLSLILLSITVDQASLDLENMPGLNLSRLLDRDSSSNAVLSVAGGLDLLVLGEVLLTSFGLTKLSRLTYIQAFAICAGLWFLIVLWRAAFAMYL